MNLKPIIFYATFILTILLTNRIQSQDLNEKIQPQEIKLLIDSIASAFNRIYIYPDKAEIIVNFLKKNLRNGFYDKLDNKVELANQLSKDIQQAHKDWHIRFGYSPKLAKDLESPPSDSIQKIEYERDLKLMADKNFMFVKTEILSGNIGYVRWDGFVDFVDAAKPTLNAALQFVRNCKAVIIDMRYNGGGSQEMVIESQSYFFDKKTRMNDIIDRNNDTVKRWADPSKTDFKLTMPVYILTSNRTGSAAEDFTYGLQQAKRVTIVGDTTAGGAHPTGPYSVGQGFVIEIPFSRSPNIFSKTDWEGTGVYPDVYSSSEKAIAKAQRLILTKMMSNAKDEKEKKIVQYALERVNSTTNNSIKLSKKNLNKYIGGYLSSSKNVAPTAAMSIIRKGNDLFRKLNDGNEVRLNPLSTNIFIYADGSERIVEFIFDTNETVSGLFLLKQNGLFLMEKKIK